MQTAHGEDNELELRLLRRFARRQDWVHRARKSLRQHTLGFGLRTPTFAFGRLLRRGRPGRRCGEETLQSENTTPSTHADSTTLWESIFSATLVAATRLPPGSTVLPKPYGEVPRGRVLYWRWHVQPRRARFKGRTAVVPVGGIAGWERPGSRLLHPAGRWPHFANFG